MEKQTKRNSFKGSIGFVLAAAGSAVGLGNIWRFPYLAAKDGGGMFLVLYIVLAVTFGFTLLITEIAIGRKTKQSPLTAYGMIHKKWKGMGIIACLIPGIIMPYYCAIGGWVLKYFLVYIVGYGTEAAQDGYFTSFISENVGPIVMMLMFLAAVTFVVFRGVNRGIEACSKILMPILFVLVLIIAIFSLTISYTDDAGVTRTGLQGLHIYLVPNVTGMTVSRFIGVLLDAMGQLFFSLSVAMGIMVAYGSYVHDDANLKKSVNQIEIFDTIVAILAGVMIIPAVYTFAGTEGMEASGPGLMFVSLPKVFAAMGKIGNIVGCLFFAMVLFAAITSAVSIMEAVVSSLMDQFHIKRVKAVIVEVAITIVVATLVCLGYNHLYFELKLPTGAKAQILDILDYISNNILMPLVAIGTCILIGWIVKPKTVIEEIEKTGCKMGRKTLYRVMIKFIAPIMLFVLFLKSVGLQSHALLWTFVIGTILMTGILLIYEFKLCPPEEPDQPEQPEVPEEPEEEKVEKVYNILLLTNRDSDNVGDQVIEASDISLIQAVMKNLGLEKKHYVINSRAASLITKDYIRTKDETLLKNADEIIQNSDIIIFGGAPVFNFAYQVFYERTAVTLEIADKYHKPVIFSAIGVEGYDDGNPRCMRLKETLNLDCVKQITTRDDFESLQKFIENEQIKIDKVSDPAVFSSTVFRKFKKTKPNTEDKKTEEKSVEEKSVEEKNTGDISTEDTKKKIGLFVMRANGFSDNGYDFSKDDAAKLWKDLISEFESRGYDYNLLTSGHFGDEAFLDYLIRKHGVDPKKCVFNMNSPEKLISKISSFDAVITCRLHPSIISYSLGVPSLGIVWNSKVPHFYNSIGYGDRIIEVEDIDAGKLAEKVDLIMSQGVSKEEDYLVTVYNYLFNGLKEIICPESDSVPYSYSELLEKIPAYAGTPKKEQEEKIKRKFRRTYENYNMLADEKIENQAKIKDLVADHGFSLVYNGGVKSEDLTWEYDETLGDIQKLSTGSIEYREKDCIQNDGQKKLMKNGFSHPDYVFMGWRMRIKENNIWYWYLEDESLKMNGSYNEERDGERYLFKDEEVLPKIPADVMTVVLEAVWEQK